MHAWYSMSHEHRLCCTHTQWVTKKKNWNMSSARSTHDTQWVTNIANVWVSCNCVQVERHHTQRILCVHLTQSSWLIEFHSSQSSWLIEWLIETDTVTQWHRDSLTQSSWPIDPTQSIIYVSKTEFVTHWVSLNESHTLPWVILN